MKDTLVNQTGQNHPFKVLLYYKMQKIADPAAFTAEHKAFCEKHHLRGRILIGKEGLNGTCSGLAEDIESYKKFVHSLPGFEDLWFKEQDIEHHPFPKLSVKHRDEIVVMKSGDVNPEKGADHLSPTQVNELVEKHGEDVVFFDMRSVIEHEVGHFKNAVVPDIRFFREFPEKIKEFEQYKDKKVVMYCTGGIRCEKASPLMKEAGFKEVYQVDGGVYNYCTQYPNDLFEGSCFVFDDRMQIWFDEDNKITTHADDGRVISHCQFCGVKTARVVNDERKKGRVMVVCCSDCDAKLDVSRVRYKYKHRAVEKERILRDEKNKIYVGKGEHYFAKAKVAQFKIEDGFLRHGDKIVIEGPTTGSVALHVDELKIHGREDSVAKRGDIITMPMDVKIRPSDKIYRILG